MQLSVKRIAGAMMAVPPRTGSPCATLVPGAAGVLGSFTGAPPILPVAGRRPRDVTGLPVPVVTAQRARRQDRPRPAGPGDA